MNRRFALPAAIALTAHAVLFLGSGRPPSPVIGSNTLPLKPEHLPDLAKEIVIALNRDDGDETIREATSQYRPSQDERPGKSSSDNRDVQNWQPHVPIEPGKGPRFDGSTSGTKPGVTNFEKSPMSLGDLDLPPRTRSQSAPEYPNSLKSLAVTGEVLVEFTVDESGRVHDPRVLRSSHKEFETPTLEAVSRWRFEPGRHHGLPVQFKMAIPIVFKIDS